MTVNEAILTLNANVVIACERAGFSSATVKMIEDALDIIEDALKAQEPRVMTLEELVVDDVIWLEDCDKEITMPGIYCNRNNTGPVFATRIKGYLFVRIVRNDEYGKRWRCWTSRPDNATWEATPWQGSSNL